VSDALTIELCSPTTPPVELHAERVMLPGAAGVMTILPGHTEVLTLMNSGVVIAESGEDQTFFSVHGGFVEILKNRIVILADLVESGKKIDLKRAQSSHERAHTLLHSHSSETDTPRAEASLQRAAARIQAHTKEPY
jgi:F-type H+-transporting ATPase subunit epsilon